MGTKTVAAAAGTNGAAFAVTGDATGGGGGAGGAPKVGVQDDALAYADVAFFTPLTNKRAPGTLPSERESAHAEYSTLGTRIENHC